MKKIKNIIFSVSVMFLLSVVAWLVFPEPSVTGQKEYVPYSMKD